jgi:hypothetical protein
LSESSLNLFEPKDEVILAFKDDGKLAVASKFRNEWMNEEKIIVSFKMVATYVISQWMKYVLFLLVSYIVEKLESAYAISWHASWILF